MDHGYDPDQPTDPALPDPPVAEPSPESLARMVEVADELADRCDDLLAVAKGYDVVLLPVVTALDQAHDLLVQAANGLAGKPVRT